MKVKKENYWNDVVGYLIVMINVIWILKETYFYHQNNWKTPIFSWSSTIIVIIAVFGMIIGFEVFENKMNRLKGIFYALILFSLNIGILFLLK